MTKGERVRFGDLKGFNTRRCEEVFHKLIEWSPTDWATAFAGEAGEACNVVKKIRRLDGADKGKDTEKEQKRLSRLLGSELADTVIYADLLASRMGLSLGDEVRKKFNAVSRKRGATIFL